MKYLVCLLIVIQSTSVVFGQSSFAKEILFTVDGKTNVTAEEFMYMYKKNNFNNEDGYSKEDINKYLELYKIFKLKIIEAQNLGYDTAAGFQEEFNQYKDQLTNNYLRTNSVIDSLVKEAYDRYMYRVKASHILIRLDKDALPKDTLEAYDRIMEIREMALSGQDFSDLAKQFSEDPSAKVNGGDLSYFTSMHMVYPFETAAYNTLPGEISKPVRTQFGYHIIKVTDKEPNEKVEVAHIMIRNLNGEEQNAQDKIFDIYDQLKGGVDWDMLCKQFSEDGNTKNKGGKIKPFVAGQMPKEFQEAAFGLTEIGQISDPFTTPYGWHIVKLINKMEVESFDEMKPQIRNRIKRDEREEVGKKALVKKLKKSNNFQQINTIDFSTYFDNSLLQGDWIPTDTTQLVLFTFPDKNYSSADFNKYVLKQQKPVRGYTVMGYGQSLFESFVEEAVINYEKAHLGDKFIDYRMLVNEYREGIMLFNLMDEVIWSKAAEDTIGLRQFFEANSSNYKWNERAEVLFVDASQRNILEEIKSELSNDSLKLTKKDLEALYNKKSSLTLQVTEGLLEKDNSELLNDFDWKTGVQEKENEGRFELLYISKILPEQSKKLNEVKGIVIADYQTELEKQWVDSLKQKYPIKVNKKVYKNVLKELEK